MNTQIPEKLYYKIGEVAKITGIKTHVLRYWETEFKAIRPNKSRSNQRLYRQQDIDLILHLKDLLYKQGFTISGARKKLREKKSVTEVEKQVSPNQTDQSDSQLDLPLASGIDKKLLQEIRQDILKLKNSLNAKS